MEIFEVRSRNQMLLKNLLEVWEDSVKATHTFLSNEEIENSLIHIKNNILDNIFRD